MNTPMLSLDRSKDSTRSWANGKLLATSTTKDETRRCGAPAVRTEASSAGHRYARLDWRFRLRRHTRGIGRLMNHDLRWSVRACCQPGDEQDKADESDDWTYEQVGKGVGSRVARSDWERKEKYRPENEQNNTGGDNATPHRRPSILYRNLNLCTPSLFPLKGLWYVTT